MAAFAAPSPSAAPSSSRSTVHVPHGTVYAGQTSAVAYLLDDV